jgi:hypothetical protein
MINASESICKRSDLEMLFDIAYVLVKESRPVVPRYLTKKTGLNHPKLLEILEKEKDFITSYGSGNKRFKKYELSQLGKELIYTWVDYIYTFNLRDLLNSKLLSPLSDEGNSRLKNIMGKTWRKPNYVKSNLSNRRTMILLYRDFLSYIKSYYPRETYQLSIIRGINIESKTFRKIKEIAVKKNHVKLRYAPAYRLRRWEHFVLNRGGFKIFPIKSYQQMKIKRKELMSWHGNTSELISLTEEGYNCVNTFDKIMMEYGLTDWVCSHMPNKF